MDRGGNRYIADRDCQRHQWYVCACDLCQQRRHDSHNVGVPDTGPILYMSSADGGATFSDPEICVDGIGDITANFPPKPPSDWPQFPGGTFRVLSLVSIAPIGERGCIIAWADARGSFARIFYRMDPTMVLWLDENSGRPLLGDMGFSD